MRRHLLAMLAPLFLLASASAAVSENSHGASYFPNLPVVDQDGRKFAFYDDLIKGKMVVVSFIYTHCPDLCPLTTARLSQLQEKLGDRLGRDVFFYSITVDPLRDTPAELKKFAEAFDAKPGWGFLTGDPDAVKKTSHALGDRSRTLSEHRNEIVIGNDVTGQWSRNSLMGDLASVELDIRQMDPSWRQKADSATNPGMVDKVYDIGAAPGQAMFTKLCTPCHSIGGGDRVGPDLAGVVERRPREWLEEFIMFPDRMRQRKDPETMALLARYPKALMPALGLTPQDTSDIIEFLKSRNKG
ncbi:MAG: c-type cytochrome [Hyphomicrobiales bacterium]|nr:MAG: c-type cytochrome [Hyphomicrobiales bacterium]